MKKDVILFYMCTVVISLSLNASWAQELQKIDLDDASSIGIKIESDTVIKVEGKAAVKITTAWPTTVCLAEVSDLQVEAARLIYRAKVRTDIQGDVFLEM